ncbi:MAG: hypothetical protein ACOYMA_16730 [Bacteroidia bacterium]
MKRNVLLIITCFVLNNVKANSDSLYCVSDSNICTEIIDCNIIEGENVATLESTPDKVIKKLENKKVKTKDNLSKPANWFEDAWNGFTDLFKPIWGYYEEDDMNKEGPYFMFNRMENNNINNK